MKVLFNKLSANGSGKANLVESPGDVTWGVELISKNIYWKSSHSLLTESMIVTSTHSILMTNDQPGQRCATRRIVSTAAAAAMLPHSKLRDKRLTSGQDLIQRTMELTMVGSLGAG